jgi:beta-galactosidase
LQNLVSDVSEIKIKQLAENEVEIRLSAFSSSSVDPSKRAYEWFSSSGFERNETWTFKSDGTIELEQEIIPHGSMPDMLQKTGLQFQLPKSFSNVEWYGRGPFETYPDRKTGAKVGLYQSNAEKMYEPYIIPQEYGNRTDVRLLKVQNEEGKGLQIKGDELFNFSLHKYTTDNLDRAMHAYQLKEAPHTILNVDYEVTGVGGTAIRQLQKYRVMPGVRKYKITIKPY